VPPEKAIGSVTRAGGARASPAGASALASCEGRDGEGEDAAEGGASADDAQAVGAEKSAASAEEPAGAPRDAAATRNARRVPWSASSPSARGRASASPEDGAGARRAHPRTARARDAADAEVGRGVTRGARRGEGAGPAHPARPAAGAAIAAEARAMRRRGGGGRLRGVVSASSADARAFERSAAR
jgi:hypothetical protein